MNQNLNIKICGMKHAENIQQIATLLPDYLGFIFYKKSPRNFTGEIPEIPSSIKKTGVFVDTEIAFIIEKVEKYNFKAVQLHGNESTEYCETLRKKLPEIEIFKVFGIKDSFDFSIIKNYEHLIDFFLFDTKGKQKGGNGYTFDWSVLKNYPSKTPIILSGGIGIDELEKVEQILKSNLPIHALDLNSKFEIKPGVKDILLLKKFIKNIKLITKN